MSLRVLLEEDAIKGATQAFDVVESIKQSLGAKKIFSSAPFADPEMLLPEVEISKLFDPPEKFMDKITLDEL